MVQRTSRRKEQDTGSLYSGPATLRAYIQDRVCDESSKSGILRLIGSVMHSSSVRMNHVFYSPSHHLLVFQPRASPIQQPTFMSASLFVVIQPLTKPSMRFFQRSTKNYASLSPIPLHITSTTLYDMVVTQLLDITLPRTAKLIP